MSTEPYPDLKVTGIVDFLKHCRRGRAITVDQTPPAVDENTFEQQHQRAKFLKSIQYLRKHCVLPDGTIEDN